MKKSILTLFFILWVFGISYSQNYKLVDLDGIDVTNSQVNVELTPEQIADYYTDVVYEPNFINLTNQSKTIRVRRIIENAVDSVENLLCWGLCNGPGNGLSISKVVDSMQTVDYFKAHYKAYRRYGSSNYTYVFFDVNNPSDTIFIKVNFNTGTLGLNKLNSKSNGLSVFPNPANQKLELAFAQNNSNKEVKITNILGSVVKSQSINKLESNAVINTQDLEDGVYFVQLLSNGKIESNKRVIIKH